jgi:hypothetical protein
MAVPSRRGPSSGFGPVTSIGDSDIGEEGAPRFAVAAWSLEWLSSLRRPDAKRVPAGAGKRAELPRRAFVIRRLAIVRGDLAKEPWWPDRLPGAWPTGRHVLNLGIQPKVPGFPLGHITSVRCGAAFRGSQR